jgi:type II secretory pathway predicted ATPase ExeA
MYIADSSLTPRHFYNGILSQLGVEGKFYRGDSKRILQRELEILTVLQHITPVIIVDEAHLLEREMLEELRFMLNVDVDSQSPMSLILSGQPELKATLKRQSSLAISQRVNIQCETRYLDVAQTKEYILHQLRYAKSKSDIFSDEAISQIQKYTHGSPREINKLCTHALIYGSQQNKKILDDRCIELIGKEEM